MQPAAAVVAAARERGVVVHVDACAAAGHVAVDFARSAPTSARSPRTSSAARRAPARCSCAAACGSRRSWSAARRNGPGAAASRTCPPSWGSAPRRPTPCSGRRRGRERAAHRPAGRARRVAAVAGVDALGDPVDALPHLVCLGVEGVEAEPILLALDQHGVAVHSGSSCSSETLEPSPVLAAMGVDADRSLRASVGWSSTDADVDAFLDAFPEVVEMLRGLRR